MSPAPSIARRALLAVLLMTGFYLLALAIVLGLLSIPYAEWTYAGRLHVKLALVCIVGALIIFWSILPRVDRFKPPGPRLLPGKYPRLFAELEGVARAVSQEMPAEVYAVHDVNAWVMQRGGVMGVGSRRVMGLGLPLMRILSISQLRAVLAHEFGHYYGGDTKLGPWVYKTRSAIVRTIQSLAGEGGQGSLLQLPFIGYGKMFLRVTHAVSRQQEFSADNLAARTVGSKPLITGLQTVHGFAPAFAPFWFNEFVPVLNSGYRPSLIEGFERFVESKPIAEAVSKHLQEQMEGGKTDPYDTHPPLKERIAAVESLPPGDSPGDDPAAVTLLDEVAELEKQVLVALAGADKVEPLKSVAWEEVGPKVYVPIWTGHVRAHAAGLAGVTPASLPQLAADLKGFAARLVQKAGKSVPEEKRVPFASACIGAALTVLLVKRGWTVHTAPGSSIFVRHGEEEIEPFGILAALASGKLSAEVWQRHCAGAGIAGVDLAAVAG